MLQTFFRYTNRHNINKKKKKKQIITIIPIALNSNTNSS